MFLDKAAFFNIIDDKMFGKEPRKKSIVFNKFIKKKR